jgi:hypothetical protein
LVVVIGLALDELVDQLAGDLPEAVLLLGVGPAHFHVAADDDVIAPIAVALVILVNLAQNGP